MYLTGQDGRRGAPENTEEMRRIWRRLPQKTEEMPERKIPALRQTGTITIQWRSAAARPGHQDLCQRRMMYRKGRMREIPQHFTRHLHLHRLQPKIRLSYCCISGSFRL